MPSPSPCTTKRDLENPNMGNLIEHPEMTVSRRGFRPDAQNERGARGFSLTELLIVLAIISVIMAIAIPNLISAVDQARVARAVGDINAIEIDITEYQITNAANPNTLADVGRSAMLDPWGNPYQYYNQSTATGNGVVRLDEFNLPLNTDYDLYSMGKDGQTAASITSATGRDDVVRGSNGSYVGPAAAF